jgi:hypothetical protein
MTERHVELLYLAHCPNVEPTVARIRKAEAATKVKLNLVMIEVHDEHQAQTLGFAGSPTVRIDGVDLEGENVPPTGLQCRVYEQNGKRSGIPDSDLLVRKLREPISRK